MLLKRLFQISLFVIAFVMTLSSPTFAAATEKSKDKKSKEESAPSSVQSQMMPLFQDGEETNFQRWLISRIEYPKRAARQKIGGNVIVYFIIDKEGYPKKFEVVATPDPLLSNEVIRVIKSSPKWTPAYKDGVYVPVKLAYNVMFNI